MADKLVDIGEAVDTRKKRKAQQEAERKATKAQYQRILAQRAEEELKLQMAAQNAVTLRRQLGAFTGSVAFMGHDIMKAAAVGWGAFLLTNLESLFISKFSDTLGVEKNAGLAWSALRCPPAYRSL